MLVLGRVLSWGCLLGCSRSLLQAGQDGRGGIGTENPKTRNLLAVKPSGEFPSDEMLDWIIPREN